MGIFLWLVLALLVVALMVALVLRFSSRAPESAADAASPALQLDRKAQAELAAGNLAAARELFVEAKRFGKAAQVAFREGKVELAAELFEKDGRLDKAIAAYRKAGNAPKVRELQARMSGEAAAPGADAAHAPSARPAASDADRNELFGGRAAPNAAGPGGAAGANALVERSAEATDAWLLEEDSLLQLPSAAVAPAPEPAPSGSTAQRMALGVIGLIKTRKSRSAIVEETVSDSRSDDSR